ncbi:MAG TPA: pilus assembly protein TadG-related protein [Candidatus Acidoferrales bacterium]|nr:pilus assembly protein TadG-related protein [Candidatus Acidoferrales bacterium]
MSLPLLVILVPVLFGMMGFALDLGRLYLVRGELNQAANAMALNAAAQLNQTAFANTAIASVLPPNGPAYKYNFAGLTIGQGSVNLTSTINPPACFGSVTAASTPGGAPVDCSDPTAQFVNVTITADAPLLFWSLLPGGSSRKTPIVAQAVAGISAPLCTACHIVPIAIAALDPTDTANFGFDASFSTLYTLSYSCTGTPTPVNLLGTTSVGPAGQSTVPYVLLNRFDANNATLSESDQAFQDGAAGIAASVNPTPNTLTSSANTPLSCVNVNDTEQIWASAVPAACAAAAIPTVEATLCGIYTRLDDPNNQAACATAVSDFSALAPLYLPDSNASEAMTDAYQQYAGNGRRIITVAIVDVLAANTVAPMTVLGFRQFLVTPSQDGSFFVPSDSNSRIPVLYIGNPAPVPGGWFDTRYANACVPGSFTGPGKVVLHQ